jgi:hypothetical protein
MENETNEHEVSKMEVMEVSEVTGEPPKSCH